MEFDDLFQYVGDVGLYQICVFMIMVMSMTLAGTFDTPFRIAAMDHWCKIPSLQNFSVEQQKYIAIPIDTNGDYDSCKMFGLDFSSYSLEDLANWNSTEMYGGNTSVPTVPCTAWEYDRSQYEESTVSAFDLVCDRASLNVLPLSISSVGGIIGGLLSGYLSDRFGRKKLFIISLTLGYGVTNLLIALARQYWLYFVGVALHGIAMGGRGTAFVIAMEVAGPTARGHFGMGYWMFFSVGIATSCIYAYFIRSYRYLTMVNFLALFVWAFIWFIPEPPRRLIQHDRIKEATSIFKRMARMNRKTLPDDLDKMMVDIRDQEVKKRREAAAVKSKNFTDLFKSKKLALRMIVLFYNHFAHTLIYYTIAIHVGRLAGSIYINSAVMGLIEVPSIILGSLLMNWKVIGRRYMVSGGLFLCGVTTLVIVPLVEYDIDMGVRVLSFIGKGLVSASFSGLDVVTLEVIPTEVRQIGFAIASVFGGIGGMTAPFMGDSMANIWLPLPNVVNGIIAITASIAFLYLPETVGKEMCQTVEKAKDLDRSRTHGIVNGAATLELDSKQPIPPDTGLGYGKEEMSFHSNLYNINQTKF